MATVMAIVRAMPAVMAPHVMRTMPAMVTSYVVMTIAVTMMMAILHLGRQAFTGPLHRGS